MPAQAIARILNHHFDVPEVAVDINMSGKTDPQIFRAIFASCGKSEILETNWTRVLDLYLDVLQDEIRNSSHYVVHEGVVDLLDRIAAHDTAYLGLLTGNLERGARMKLARCDLNQYFAVGAFGSDSPDRLQLPAVARDRAQQHFQVEFLPEDMVIIGDSIYDILCAQGYGATSIAVNTGRTTWGELEEHDPNYLFPSLKDTDKLMHAIFSGRPDKTRLSQES